MAFKLNVFTGQLDYTLPPNSASFPTNPLYITPTTYFKYEGGELNLYVNGVLQQSWEVTPTHASGEAMGLLLALTYA